MPSSLAQSLTWLKTSGQEHLLSQLQHGIEKEGLRVDQQGQLSQQPHPRGLGSALTHEQITTDYSEALLEFITPVFSQPEQGIEYLADLHRYAYTQLSDEQIWGGSMPGELPPADQIPIAEYGSSNIGQLKHIYRVGLEHRYGRAMQTIAGIHYNFSLPCGFWPLYQQYKGSNTPLQGFQSAAYFALIRNFRRYSWLLLYLFGASPALCSSFMKDKPHNLEQFDDETLYLPWATSLRMSDLGYSNKAQSSLGICFNQLNTYLNSLHQAIHTPHPPYEKIGIKVDGQYRQLNSNILQIENEYYSDIRPKRVIRSGEKPIHALMNRGVEYIEVRNIDINPFLPVGIDAAEADFLNLFLLSCLFMGDDDISAAECGEISENQQRVVNRGREPGLTLTFKGEAIALQDWGIALLEQLSLTAATLDRVNQNTRYSETLAIQKAKLLDSSLTPSAQVLAAMRDQHLSHAAFVMQQSQLHQQTLSASPLNQDLFSTLRSQSEASLQAQAALEAAPAPDFDSFLASYLAN
ncbi:glutamate--cysteine ligase [Neptuniibacter sp. CAU 1671]|uniref:glutamate--cysteine ligase n=1 Tax=Neptuniibacter sp. CAU 1671 TaxID=3032593 RepID=UPI0023DC547D|nr:glutamate--cysteine ligase [Neptuniibacter sp. CAU 1671]MDF2182600.1 glutamate--cysteine ligase [Neptuniibacter sp. CAU 1671]